MLESALLETLVTQGPFAALFVWLLFHQINTSKEREENLLDTNKEREERLHGILDKFSEKYDVIIDELRDLKDKFKE